jgi:hypothetical protein
MDNLINKNRYGKDIYILNRYHYKNNLIIIIDIKIGSRLAK